MDDHELSKLFKYLVIGWSVIALLLTLVYWGSNHTAREAFGAFLLLESLPVWVVVYAFVYEGLMPATPQDYEERDMIDRVPRGTAVWASTEIAHLVSALLMLGYVALVIWFMG